MKVSSVSDSEHFDADSDPQIVNKFDGLGF
jgi:hypothetical protein